MLNLCLLFNSKGVSEQIDTDNLTFKQTKN